MIMIIMIIIITTILCNGRGYIEFIHIDSIIL